MRTDRVRRVLVVLAIGSMTTGTAAVGQTVNVDRETQIRSVDFDVRGDLTSDAVELASRVAARGRGGNIGLRRVLGWMPFVRAVEQRYFDPLELQRDKERLRLFLEDIGYGRATVDYEVSLDEEENVVDIVFRLVPGPPLVVRRISIAWADSVSPLLAPDSAIESLRPLIGLREGGPLDERAIAPAAQELVRWLTNRGRAFASVRPEVDVDSAAWEAEVSLIARVGPRARIGEISVDGAPELPDDYVLNFVGVEPGDWFSTRRLRTASRRLATLDVVGSAAFEVPPGQPADTVVNVVLRVHEEMPRDISGQLGYATDGGLGGEAQWTHRSIFGRGQTLTANLIGQSGVLAVQEEADRFVRSTLTLRQPLRASTQLTLHVGPFAEYRDDRVDRSLELGAGATLIYQLGGISSVALRYEFSTRRIFEYRFGGPGGIDFLELLQLGAEGALDEFGTRINTSIVSLSSSLGWLDSPTDPRRGFTVHPNLAITVPGSFTSRQYLTGGIVAAGYWPLSERIGVAARAGGGKLIPFGISVPASPDDGLAEYFRLRDALFTGGGLADVRGWSDELLGPKFPQATFTQNADSTVSLTADRYTPIGGFNRLYGNLELRLPVPLLGENWGSYVFADAGRIWTRDERFTDSADPLGVEKLFWSLGGGIDYNTPLGAVRLAVGYKMNPSIFDLAEPMEVLDAIIQGQPLEDLPRHNGRRFHIHIGVGRRL